MLSPSIRPKIACAAFGRAKTASRLTHSLSLSTRSAQISPPSSHELVAVEEEAAAWRQARGLGAPLQQREARRVEQGGLCHQDQLSVLDGADRDCFCGGGDQRWRHGRQRQQLRRDRFVKAWKKEGTQRMGIFKGAETGMADDPNSASQVVGRHLSATSPSPLYQ